MNRLVLTVVVMLALAAPLFGCAYKGYEEPTLPDDQVAHLRVACSECDFGRRFRVRKFDGKPVLFFLKAKLLPGQHTLSAQYSTLRGGGAYYGEGVGFGSRAQTAFTTFVWLADLSSPPLWTTTEEVLTFEAEAGHTYEISPFRIEDTTFAWIEGAPAAGLVTPPAAPINFERDRQEIIKAIREYYDGPGETYDHPNSSLGGTMGTLKSLTKLHLVGDQIEVAAKYTWLPNSDWGGQMESPHDGRFVLKRQGDTYQVVKMWSKDFGWKPDKIAGEVVSRMKSPAEKQREKRLVAAKKAREKHIEKFFVAAEKGDPEAQFQLYTRDKPDGKSLTWLCLAANQGHALAQEEHGDLHVQGLGRPWREAGLVKLDHVRAYMWYSLAAANGVPRAGFTRDYLADQMTPAQIAEAERLAAEWKPGDCGAEDRTAKSTK